MKMKTTLCAVLLSLTSVSMVACSSGDSAKGNKTTVTKAAPEVDSLTASLEKAKADLVSATAERDQLIMTSEVTAMEVKQAEADYKTFTQKAVDTGDYSALGQTSHLQEAVAEAKANNDEVNKEVKTANLVIGGLELTVDKIEAQLRIRKNTKLLSEVSNISDVGASMIDEEIKADKEKISEIDEKLSPKGM